MQLHSEFLLSFLSRVRKQQNRPHASVPAEVMNAQQLLNIFSILLKDYPAAKAAILRCGTNARKNKTRASNKTITMD